LLDGRGRKTVWPGSIQSKPVIFETALRMLYHGLMS
jgi:hypothetical protein